MVIDFSRYPPFMREAIMRAEDAPYAVTVKAFGGTLELCCDYAGDKHKVFSASLLHDNIDYTLEHGDWTEQR